MAASMAQRPLLYLSFDDPQLTKELQTMLSTLGALGCSVGEVFGWLIAFDVNKGGAIGLFSYITSKATSSSQ
jgi:hypothetical protein